MSPASTKRQTATKHSRIFILIIVIFHYPETRRPAQINSQHISFKSKGQLALDDNLIINMKGNRFHKQNVHAYFF